MASPRRVSDVHKLMNPTDQGSDSKGENLAGQSAGNRIVDILQTMPVAETGQDGQAKMFKPSLPPINIPNNGTTVLDRQNSHSNEAYIVGAANSTSKSFATDNSSSHNAVSGHHKHEDGQNPVPVAANHWVSERHMSDKSDPARCSNSTEPQSSNSSLSKASLSSLLHLSLAGPNALNSPSSGSSRFGASSGSQGSSLSRMSSNHLPEFTLPRGFSSYTGRSPADDFAVQTLTSMKTGHSGNTAVPSRWSQIAQGSSLPPSEGNVSPTDIRSPDRLEQQVHKTHAYPVLPPHGPTSLSHQAQVPVSEVYPSDRTLPQPYHTMSLFRNEQSYPVKLFTIDPAIASHTMETKEEPHLSATEAKDDVAVNETNAASGTARSRYGYGPVDNEISNAVTVEAMQSTQIQHASATAASPPEDTKVEATPATAVTSPPQPSGTQPSRQDRTFVCCFAGDGIPCDTANNNARKGFSDFFGRNKVCTKAIPNYVWDWMCRQHYQRCKYRCSKNKAYGEHKAEKVKKQAEKMEYYLGARGYPQHGPITWTIGFQKSLATAVHKAQDRMFRGQPMIVESDEPKTQVLNTQVRLAFELMGYTGENKSLHDCLKFIDKLLELGQRNGLNDLIPAELLPVKWGGVDYGRGVTHKRRS